MVYKGSEGICPTLVIIFTVATNPNPSEAYLGCSLILPSSRRPMTQARVMSPSSNALAHQQPEPQHVQRHSCQSVG